ncbi:MAG: MarR family winged helix-turn-helix transcriptional regulator [Eubacteriales bacterium]|jgi:DNA-binding MarR family transcriptional regulator
MHPQPQDSLSYRLLSAFFRFLKTPWHIVAAPGLTRTETGILIGIDRSSHTGKPLRISDLSHIMRVSPPTISQHINNLEDQGFVIRTQAKDDKRAVNLALSEKGRETLRQQRAVMEQNINQLAEHLGRENTETLITLLTKTSDFFFERESTEHDGSESPPYKHKKHRYKYPPFHGNNPHFKGNHPQSSLDES